MFSETRTAIGKRILPGGHMLLGSTTATNSSGVAILLHQRHRNSFSNVQCISDRLMSIDLQCSGGVVRLVAGYAPHMGYSQDELQTFYDQLFYVLRGLKQHCVGAIVGGISTRSYVLDCVDKCSKTCFTVSFLKLQTDSPKCKMRMILGLFEAQLASRGGSTLFCIHLTCAVSTVMQQMIWI